MKRSRARAIRHFTASAVTVLAAAACETTDCPLNNVVRCNYGFYAVTDEGEAAVTLPDTLTITAAGTDSVLLNRGVNARETDLPVSYTAAEDNLVFHLTDTAGRTRRDTIWMKKENLPHYEAPDCPASMFHLVTGVRCTHRFIDSVVIANPNINYDPSEHFKIYFRSRD